MKTTILACLALGALCCSNHVAAQTESESKSEFYIGLGGGINVSKMRFSNLDKDYFPTNKSNLSGVFSVFGEWDFGPKKMLAIRPQFSFLTRGGKLSDIGRKYIADYIPDYSEILDPIENPYLEDLTYSVKATYWDIRLPIIFQPGNSAWKVRPYVYLAPIVGFVTSGYVKTEAQYSDQSYTGYKFKASKSNMASTYFAGALGVGAKYQFDISGNKFFLGLDLNYQLGFTDTYSSNEKDGKNDFIINIGPQPGKKAIGSRKFDGFEMQMTLGIPLSVFKKKKQIAVAPEPVYEPEPVYTFMEVVEEKPCYSLDEIISLLKEGRSVEGKTICAIDDINFDFGKNKIKPESYPYLNKLAQTLIKTGANVVVKGHTDNVGSEETNLELSKQRAKNVVDYLHRQGVSADKLSYKYYGMSRPLTTNDTEEGRKLNRRVEFELR